MLSFIPFLIVLGVISISWILATAQHVTVMAAIAGAVLVPGIFLLNEALLPTVLILTLALGSSYNYEIGQKTFYVRFAVLTLIAIRSFLLVMQRKGTKGHPRFPITWVHAFFLYVGFFGILTSVYSVSPGVSVQRAVSFLLLYVVAFHYFWSQTSTATHCQKVAESFWWAILVILGVGYVFLITGNSAMYKAGRLRLLLGNPNQLAHYCAIMSPITYWYWVEHAKGRSKTIAGAVMALVTISLILSGSRGGLVAAMCALLFFFSLCYRKRLMALIFLIAFITPIQFFVSKNEDTPFQGPGFFQETILREGELATGSGRTDIWKAAIRLINREPLIGYGFGAVETMFNKGYFPELPNFQGEHVHNSYLEELLNLGWLGALPLFLAVVYILFKGFQILVGPHIITPELKFSCALFASFIAACISGIFESWFTSVGSIFCFPFWLLVSLMLKMIFHFNNWSKPRTAT